MVFEIKNKVAVITGAATGIGSLIVRNLVAENVKHVAILDIAEAPGKALQGELNSKYGNKVKFYKCDVTKEDQLFEVFNTVNESQDGIDILINNAGILNDSLDTYKLEIDLNVTSLITSTIKGLQLMGKDKGGKGGVIVNTSSIAALSQLPYIPIYNATKAAVLQFSNDVGLPEWYDVTGVRVITVCYGATDTPLLAALRSFDERMNPLGAEFLKGFTFQKPESAAVGAIEALKNGESGSTWLITANKPAEDITPLVRKSYGIFSERVFNP